MVYCPLKKKYHVFPQHGVQKLLQPVKLKSKKINNAKVSLLQRDNKQTKCVKDLSSNSLSGGVAN